MDVPSDYRDGYEKARGVAPGLADRYLTHTRIGDPLADAAVASIAEDGGNSQAWIRRGIEGGAGVIGDAPSELRRFFDAIEPVPSWFDPAATIPGCRAFHRNSEMFLGAFVAAVLIEGFTTLIAKSFAITGRMVDRGTRRLKQNNRHLVEIFMPGGLERHGEGWKLSVRVRLMHASVRRLLSRAPEWDESAWGTPVSAAHVAFATAAFSALLLKRAATLGVALSDEERRSFMLVWRYAGHLMGVPETLLFSSEAEALRLHEIGALCEPPPDIESIMLANGLINAAPLVAGIDDPGARRKLARKIYRISRAIIGDEMADRLHYPSANTFGTLAVLRWTNRLDRLGRRLVPALDRWRRAGQFGTMLGVSLYDADGLSYRLPEHVHAEKDGQS